MTKRKHGSKRQRNMRPLFSLLLMLSFALVLAGNFVAAPAPTGYFSDDFTPSSASTFSTRWTISPNATGRSVLFDQTGPITFLNITDDSVISNLSFFQGILEMQVNASSLQSVSCANKATFGFGLNDIDFIACEGEYGWEVAGTTLPFALGPIDNAYHNFTLTWFYSNPSTTTGQFVQACMDTFPCQNTSTSSIPTSPTHITFGSVSSSKHLYIDWVAYAPQGIFTLPTTTSGTITVTSTSVLVTKTKTTAYSTTVTSGQTIVKSTNTNTVSATTAQSTETDVSTTSSTYTTSVASSVYTGVTSDQLTIYTNTQTVPWYATTTSTSFYATQTVNGISTYTYVNGYTSVTETQTYSYTETSTLPQTLTVTPTVTTSPVTVSTTEVSTSVIVYTSSSSIVSTIVDTLVHVTGTISDTETMTLAGLEAAPSWVVWALIIALGGPLGAVALDWQFRKRWGRHGAPEIRHKLTQERKENDKNGEKKRFGPSTRTEGSKARLENLRAGISHILRPPDAPKIETKLEEKP